MDKFLLIIGAGRSGTTLLQSMLNAHPEIVFPPESHFLRKYVIPEVKGRAPRFETFDDLAAMLQNDSHLRRLGIDVREALEPFMRRHKVFSYRELFIYYLKLYAKRFSKSIVGEKDPSNTGYIKEIHKAFPKAYVIHIFRDPRDVILSRMKTDWGGKAHFINHIKNYKDSIDKAFNDGPLLFGNRYIEICYENLINEPKKELEILCDKIGISSHDDMLEFHEKSHEIVSAEEMQWKQNVFKPILKDNVQKWKKALSRWQILAIEGFCWQAFAHGNYPHSQLGGGLARQVCALPVYGYAYISRLKRAIYHLGAR